MSLIKRVLRKLKLLPNPVSHPVKRMDLKEIVICDNLSFLVYWKILAIGKGPAVILKAYNKEILKFDCFGEKDGHYHVAPNYGSRIYFLEKTVMEQVDRTVAELKINGLKYLSLQKEPEIRNLKPSHFDYNSAVDSVEKLLVHFHQTVEEIR
ncbi:hypothetical protein [Algoriphagus litoralis]|uniref:hypothetical protein n=1 Tax=Algoriphagus litoralis TaxID=2202829 RepID=UPI001300766F|nr:hypothetical protein [Algoriphagus litoralis]